MTGVLVLVQARGAAPYQYGSFHDAMRGLHLTTTIEEPNGQPRQLPYTTFWGQECTVDEAHLRTSMALNFAGMDASITVIAVENIHHWGLPPA